MTLKEEIRKVLGRSLAKMTKENNGHPKDFYTTLLFVYYHTSSKKVYIGHVGDGMIIGVKKTGFEILSNPENGEVANATVFTLQVLKDTTYLRLSIQDASEYIGFICVSDGLDFLYLKQLYHCIINKKFA